MMILFHPPTRMMQHIEIDTVFGRKGKYLGEVKNLSPNLSTGRNAKSFNGLSPLLKLIGKYVRTLGYFLD